MLRAARLALGKWWRRSTGERSKLRRWNQRLSSARLFTKYLTVLALISVVGYADFEAGEEISFSIFYMLPIVYAAWFINPEAGFMAAIISASVWFTVEVKQHPPFSSEWIPVWNALVRLAFFILGIELVRLIRKTELRLLHEVTRRTRTLRAESDRRRRLERELMEVTAREQLRFAQDLHDGLGQYLSALAFHARMLSDDLRQHGAPQLAQAERIVGIIRTTNQTIRRLDRAMRLPVPTGGGFAAAIRALAEEFQQLTGVPCDLELTDATDGLDPFRVQMLLRIVQEAMNNAVKHGTPKRITVSMVLVNGMLHTCVIDDGVGLLHKPDVESGTGLQIMKLRAELIGSQLSLRANGDAGCIVECILPLPIHRTAGRTP